MFSGGQLGTTPNSSKRALLLGEVLKRLWDKFQHDMFFTRVEDRGLTGWEQALQELECWEKVQKQLGVLWLPRGG